MFILIYTSFHVNICFICVKSYSDRPISYNVGRAPYCVARCPAGHLPMLCYVTNHLQAPYGVYFTNTRRILRPTYGAQPAAGRIVRYLITFIDIARCPVKFRYYLKFHSACTAFGRVNMRGPDGARPTFAHIGRAPGDFSKPISYDSNGALLGIIGCQASARNFQKSLKKSADARPGTGRRPSGHRPMFYESNCHR